LKNRQPLENIKRVLKDRGCLLLVDWRPDSKLAAFLSIKITSPEVLKQTLATNGFRLLKSFPAGEHHFALLFEKI
jgi:hypothetical protein